MSSDPLLPVYLLMGSDRPKHLRALRRLRARFSPDEREIVTAASDGTVRIFEVAKAEEPVDDLVQLAQLLSGHQLDPAGGLLPLDNHSLSNLWQMLRAKYPARFNPLR